MSKVDEDALLNAAVRSSESSSSEQALFYGYGFLMALLPTCADLYVTIFGLPLLEYAPIFVVVSLLSGALVAMSYQNTARFLKGKLMVERFEPQSTSAKKGRGRDDLKAQHEALSGQEAVAYSLLYNNLLYLFLVLSLAFYVLKTLPVLYNYGLSLAIAAAIVFVASK